jgi:hypothetical protein
VSTIEKTAKIHTRKILMRRAFEKTAKIHTRRIHTKGFFLIQTKKKLPAVC